LKKKKENLLNEYGNLRSEKSRRKELLRMRQEAHPYVMMIIKGG
jgi:hypothetical protein